MKIFNINSKYNVSPETHQVAIKSSDFLANTWKNVPIYLIEKELMDFLSPPKRMLGEDCVTAMTRSFQDEYSFQNSNRIHDNQDIDSNIERTHYLWEGLSECFSKHKYVSMGVYLQDIQTPQIQMIEEKMRIRLPFSPDLGGTETLLPNSTDLDKVPVLKELSDHLKLKKHLSLTPDPFFDILQVIMDQHVNMLPQHEVIFICMERVVKAAEVIKQNRPFKSKDINEIAQVVCVSLILHELVHAYLKTSSSKYGTPWGRLIEESLVTAYIMAFFKDHPYYSALKQKLSTSPLEYRAYTYFEKFSVRELIVLLNAWKSDSAHKFLKICPPSDLIAHYAGRVGPWPERDRFFDMYLRSMCSPTDNYWKALGDEILRNY